MKLAELLQALKEKENALTAAMVAGVILLSAGIVMLKYIPPAGTALIVLGSTFIYVSVIALVFVIK